ncbi:hypothetical protein SEVIR_9G352100v4 [Setaria viridis]|uniref:Moybdenum cofactor oxidoreductase dimerisation domain-containing protein n=1 Tax=Setaria viridis TaxID=4556 RepID=A0A4U6T3R6_SETVI|nr:hypothetical protein SEVIR_9G352100v2 [Setaria viridis]
MLAALLLHGVAGFGARKSGGAAAKRASRLEEAACAEARTVCVTGARSFVRFTVVDRLLHHGYNVRLALETQGFFYAKNYKMFPPTEDWENIDWSTRRPWMDFPVQSAICTLEDVDVIKEEKARIAGPALSGGDRGIERVDIDLMGVKPGSRLADIRKTTCHKYLMDPKVITGLGSSLRLH